EKSDLTAASLALWPRSTVGKIVHTTNPSRARLETVTNHGWTLRVICINAPEMLDFEIRVFGKPCRWLVNDRYVDFGGSNASTISSGVPSLPSGPAQRISTPVCAE